MFSKYAFLRTVKAKLILLSTFFCVAVIGLGLFAYSTLTTVKVGGPLYGRITQTMNIRADILPPPQYLIETELTVLQIADGVSTHAPDAVLQGYEAKLRRLQKEFENGQQDWSQQLPSDTGLARNIRALLLEKTAGSARAYYNAIFTEFLPDIYAHDSAGAFKLLHGSMKKLADEHRAYIDQLTKLTDESSRDDEVLAKQYVQSRMLFASLFIGVMFSVSAAYAYFTFRSITGPVAAAVRTVKQLEAGDLNAYVEVSSNDELGSMCESLNQAIAAVRETVQGTVGRSAHLGEYSTQLATIASTISNGVERQAANLEKTATQLTQVAGAGQAIAHGGREGQQAAAQTSNVADEGAEVVKAAISGMVSLGKSAAEITQIIDAVDEISFNTNLLAVNASVEAAVAGEQGRGFRVVADEIRSLSVRTAAAGKKIRKLVQDTQESIAVGAERVEASGKALDEIGNSVRALKAIMDEIAVSSAAQAESLSQLNQSVASISDVVELTSTGTATLNKTSRDLAIESRNIHELVASFKLG